MDKVKVIVSKYGGKKHYEWESTLVKRTSNYVVIYGLPGRKLYHYSKGEVYQFDTYSIEFFPMDEWFTVNIDVHKNGDVEYYCNICLPPEFLEGEIKFTDLDIDIIRNIDGMWSVVDEDEFKENAKKLGYPKQLQRDVKKQLENILNKINNNKFPFNGFFDKYIE